MSMVNKKGKKNKNGRVGVSMVRESCVWVCASVCGLLTKFSKERKLGK